MPLHQARLRIRDYNENRKTRLRNQERRTRVISLSLTSMVDMFAILVIFLLTSQSTVSQWIEVSHGIDLPKASHSEAPPKAASVQISLQGVYADDLQLAVIGEAEKGVFPKLREWLKKADKAAGYVNIVAHTKVPFGAVRHVVATCQEMGFGKVNLAVQPSQ